MRSLPFATFLPVLATVSTALAVFRPTAAAAPVHLVEQEPAVVTAVAPGVVLVDFGRVAFGNLALFPPAGAADPITVRFGEALAGGRVNRNPPGSVRHAICTVLPDDRRPLLAAPPPDVRNTRPPAILTPAEWGVLLPFRWVEIEGWPGELQAEQVRRRASFARTWDDQAAAFRSSDDMLNRIWELCRYSIKATTFAGVYVDGDRERIPYEADAYLNQLSHQACDPDPQMARDTFDRLMEFPTWPTEWAFHQVFMAHADWVYTGDREWLAKRYEGLKSKLLLERARADGLLVSTEAQMNRGDIVDWPIGERDGFVFTKVNTVINAFHLRALVMMAELARALGYCDEAREFELRERRTRASFQQHLFDPATGLYVDGEGTAHTSLHANLFALAFDLVLEAQRSRVSGWLAEQGMACSVYAAQYLLEALFDNGAGDAALALMAAPGDRSWRHMLESGTTITWEAWDQRYKPNQDWNHAWGAAPANLLPRFVLGVRPLAPGLRQILIRPHFGTLVSCEGRVPTMRGPIDLSWRSGETFRLEFSLPSGTSASLELPARESGTVRIDGRRVNAVRRGRWLLVEGSWTGQHTVEVH